MARTARRPVLTAEQRLKEAVQEYGYLKAEQAQGQELEDYYFSDAMERVTDAVQDMTDEAKEDGRYEQIKDDEEYRHEKQNDIHSALSNAELYIFFRPETTAAELLELLKSSLPSLTLE